jgi:hypothetical protein
MPELRDEGSALAVTVNGTEPSPCPSVEDGSVSHAASLFADHWHSRLVDTLIVPDPPAGGNAELSVCSWTAHFTADGDVTVSVTEDELQEVERSMAAAIAIACDSRHGPGSVIFSTGHAASMIARSHKADRRTTDESPSPAGQDARVRASHVDPEPRLYRIGYDGGSSVCV